MKHLVMKTLSGLFGLSGLVILGGIFFSFAQSHADAKQLYPNLISPVVRGGTVGLASIPKKEVLGTGDVGGGIDYTNATSWFPSNTGVHFADKGEITFFTLSIPELEIESAAVAVGGEELADSLIQYPGTALPGRTGNAVVFGHSILPAFFNPEDYLSIFSKIDTLERGSDIKVNFDGVTYTYKVKEMFRVKPTDVYILDQNENGSYLSLVTCFPMGDPRKPERLVVRAELSS